MRPVRDICWGGIHVSWARRVIRERGSPLCLAPERGSEAEKKEGLLWGEGLTWSFLWLLWGFPRWLSGKESVCQCRRAGLTPWVGKTLWRRKQQPTPVFLPGEAHGQRSLAGYGP